MSEEKILTNMQLLVAYARGLSYIAARPFVTGDINDFYQKEFGTSFVHVSRYTRIASLIMIYPGILVTELSFAQCVKHYKEIVNNLAWNEELAKKLKTVIVVSAQGKGVQVSPANVNKAPRATVDLSTDPDFPYEKDTWYNKDIAAEEKKDNDIDDLINWFIEESKEKREDNALTEKTQNLTVLNLNIPPLKRI